MQKYYNITWNLSDLLILLGHQMDAFATANPGAIYFRDL